MRHRLLIPLLFTVLAAPATAFQAQNDMIVEPRGAGAFHVVYRGGRAGAPDFWCAAGDYVVMFELPADGNVEWTVPTIDSSRCQLRLTVEREDGMVGKTWSGRFTISTTKKSSTR